MTIQSTDLRIFEKFGETFAMNCSFRKFAAYELLTLRKLQLTADELLGIFRNFSEHLFLGKIRSGSVQTAFVKAEF